MLCGEYSQLVSTTYYLTVNLSTANLGKVAMTTDVVHTVLVSAHIVCTTA